MANSSACVDIEIDLDPYNAEPQLEAVHELEPRSSLRLLVLANFSGQATGKLTRIDIDNFETVLRTLAPRVELALGNGQLGETELTFASLEDFEPDRIYRYSEIFAPLREKLGAQLYSEPEEGESHPPLKPTPEQIEQLTSPGGLLDAIIEKSSGHYGGAAPAPKRIDEFQSMVERIVAPYAQPAETPESRRAIAERAQRLSLLMAHILHDDQFQALEAAWRGLDLLVRGLDTDHAIQLHILDCSKEKLANQLLEAAKAGGRWGLVAANFGFDRAIHSDVELLERLGMIARTMGAPLIAEWLPSQIENAKAEAAWQAFRHSSSASYVGLALPRFLLRLPYGNQTSPVESFEFEEMPGEPVHTNYLWGNPAFACALVLGQLFQRQDSLTPTPANLRLDNMTVHHTISTEVLLSEHDCQTLLNDGVLPLSGVKETESIVFPRMQSIAKPAALLAGLQSVNW